MSFLNKIKLNYNIKLVDEYIASKNNVEIYNILKNTKTEKSDFFFTLLNYVNYKYANSTDGENLFPNKYTFISSFHYEDQKFISNFLKFYFEKNQHSIKVDDFSDAVANDLDNLKIQKLSNQITFDQMVEFSDFFLNSLLLEEGCNDYFLSSNAAFFEGPNKKFLIYPNRTRAYIFIHNHPFNIYASLRDKYQNQQQALNELFNFENNLISSQKKIKKYQVLENRQSWSVHANSWLDPNVFSSYNGIKIGINELINDPIDTLTRLIFHIKQAGLNIEVDYEDIEDYCTKYKLDLSDPEISNKEKKLIISNLDSKILKELDYEI